LITEALVDRTIMLAEQGKSVEFRTNDLQKSKQALIQAENEFYGH